MNTEDMLYYRTEKQIVHNNLMEIRRYSRYITNIDNAVYYLVIQSDFYGIRSFIKQELYKNREIYKDRMKNCYFEIEVALIEINCLLQNQNTRWFFSVSAYSANGL